MYGCHQSDLKLTCPIIGGLIRHRSALYLNARLDHAGVVHQNVESADMFNGRSNQGCRLVAIG
jgi:hypothetical protein